MLHQRESKSQFVAVASNAAVMNVAKDISLAAANAKAIAFRAGEKAKGFQPITDFINELTKDAIQVVVIINQKALEAPNTPIFDDNYAAHVEKMRFFHQRWMPSNQAKRTWIERVRCLDINILAPQHGRMFKGDDVKRFLDWFEALQVGIAV
jgi:ODP family beta lactamase